MGPLHLLDDYHQLLCLSFFPENCYQVLEGRGGSLDRVADFVKANPTVLGVLSWWGFEFRAWCQVNVVQETHWPKP